MYNSVKISVIIIEIKIEYVKILLLIIFFENCEPNTQEKSLNNERRK